MFFLNPYDFIEEIKTERENKRKSDSSVPK